MSPVLYQAMWDLVDMGWARGGGAKPPVVPECDLPKAEVVE